MKPTTEHIEHQTKISLAVCPKNYLGDFSFVQLENKSNGRADC